MSNRPSPSRARPGSPLQAARKRLGLTQSDVAEMIGVPVSSYIPWDQGRRKPQDPRVSQAIAEALRTPSDVLWPPEGNPVIGPKLRALRELQATERMLARDDHAQDAFADDLRSPKPGADNTPAPEPERRDGLASLHREIAATLDGEDEAAPGATGPVGRRPRRLIPVAASIAVVAIAGTAIATTSGGESEPARQTAAAVQDGPTAAERARTAQRAALAEAKNRGDYDAAITIAARLNDTNAAADLRQTAASVLARRARAAAERGNLPLATSRLDKAEKRYGPLPAINSVRRRIAAIENARKERAAARQRAAKRRAAARARAAAAARRRAPTQSAPPSTSSTPSTPSPTPAPSPSPAPSGDSSGGGSGGGSGGSSSKPVDPGIF